MARYIDVDKAIEEAKLCYCKDCNSYNGVMCRACAFDDAILHIEDAPTAEVEEVRHGHWIWLEGNFYECSECPNKTEVDESMNEPLYIYCPFCGAKMDGGKNENV